MRPELEQLLRRRNPSLYDRAPRERGKESAPFSPELGDGWFAILLALSEVIDRHASVVGMEHLQVLKISPGGRGGLNYYTVREDRFVRGAINAASHLSLAVSAVSGRPGKPMARRKEDAVPLASDEVDGHEPLPAHALGPLRPAVGAGQPQALSRLGQRWGDRVDYDISVPPGWADLADVALTAFAQQRHRVDWIRAWSDGVVGQLIVEWDRHQASASEAGAVAFAVSMAALTDPVTGASGPVNDAGAPAWWRDIAVDQAGPPVPWGTYDSTGAWQSRRDVVCGPVNGHPSASSLIVATHGEAGEMQVTLKPGVAQVMRQMAGVSGHDGCADLMAKLLGVSLAGPEGVEVQR